MTIQSDITAKVVALVLEQYEEEKPEKIDPEMQLVDLGLDWLASIQLIMQIEEEFGIAISDTEAQELVSVQAIVAYLQLRNVR